MTRPVRQGTLSAWALALLLGTGAWASGAEDIPPTVPPNLRKAAKKAFASGKPYFLWTIAKQPLQGMTLPGVGSVATLVVAFQKAPGAAGTEFQIRTEVRAFRTNEAGATAHVMISTAVPGDVSSGTRDLLLGSKDALSGAGVARIQLIRKGSPAEVDVRETLSNVLEVRVDFGGPR